MNLNDFVVLHILKNKSPEAPSFFKTSAFFLDTCQRWLWLANSELTLKEGLKTQGFSKNPLRYDLFRGQEAYLFLLRLNCGLESQILGETDIFGQFKESWKQFLNQSSELSSQLLPWVQKLFEDTKKIRTLYLQNLGGSSYGSLLRKLIQERSRIASPNASCQRVLLIGAGQLAQSVAPFLFDYELLIWNRNTSKLDDMTQNLAARSKNSVVPLKTSEALKKAYSFADHIVMCIPQDPANDLERIQACISTKREGRLLIHLGALAENAGPWKELPGFCSLSDLFQFQNELNQFRMNQIHEAQKACKEKAQHRTLS